MCVIIVKPEGKKLPDKETLDRCWTKNSDGGGFMYIDAANHVQIRKGYMSLQAFNAALKALPDTVLDGMMVLHMRIKTHGKIDAACTHPFPLTDDYKIMGLRKCECEIGIAHNGILSISSENENVSDTMTFIKKVLMRHPEIMTNPDETKDDDTLFNMAIGTNKFVFMVGTLNLIRMIGDFNEDKETGCFYSNDCWKKTEYLYQRTSTPRGAYSQGYDDYSDEYAAWCSNGYKSPATTGRPAIRKVEGDIVPRAKNAPVCADCGDLTSAIGVWPCSTCTQYAFRPYFQSLEDKAKGIERDYSKIAERIRDSLKESELNTTDKK